MVIVLGHIAEAVVAALGERPFHRAKSDPDAPMYESIRVGLRAAHRIGPSSTVVLQPCDHPEVSLSTLRVTLAWSLKRPGQAIIPQFNARGGHPVLIPPKISAVLLEASCPEGLGQFWLDHPELCVRVSIDDPTIIRDIDTPADLP
jgi:CTP:molybdopterin cytidylyltransferase MocA